MGLVGGILACCTVPALTPDELAAQGLRLRESPCVLMSPVDFLTDPLRWVRALSAYKATHTQAPNFAYALAAARAAAAVQTGALVRFCLV